MVFRDTLQILCASLKQLAASCAKVSCGFFQYFYDVVSDVYPEADFKLLEQNAVFCNHYVDSFARRDELALQPQKALLYKLRSMECWQSNYAHVQQVCANFLSRSLKEYMALYLLSDFCLLDDVFQAFSHNSLDE